MTQTDHYTPANWLRELTRLHPAQWPWGQSLRAAIVVAAPLAVGLATGHETASLWVTLGAFNSVAGEGAGTYRSRFTQIAISGLGAAGFLAGYLTALPYPLVIAAMTVLAFLAGIVSSYGAAFSVGAMRIMLTASIAIGLPEVAASWQPALLFLLGIAFHALLLGLEAVIDRRRPERRMLADYVAGLAALAEARVRAPAGADETPDLEAARRRVTDASKALYAVLLDGRRHGRTGEWVWLAGTLDATDLIFSGILGETDPAALREAGEWLHAASTAIRRNAAVPPPAASASRLTRRLGWLADAIAAQEGQPAPAPGPATEPPSGEKLVTLADRLIVGRSVLIEAASLALCIALAFATRYVIDPNHWYWVPLTVAIVMKPDLGSIFVRAVQRAAGTAIGVVIGTAILILVPKGAGLIVVLAVLTAALPWSKLVSYAVQGAVLTPVILILLDLIAPTPHNIDYGMPRLVNTLIGGAIVLLFGYFLWPRTHGRQLAEKFEVAMAEIADYLVAACAPLPDDKAERLAQGKRTLSARRACYGALSDLRSALARSMAEPPPAGREAAAWFPIVAGAERLCDRITAHAASRGPDTPEPPAQDVAAMAARLRAIARAGPPGPQPPAHTGNDFLDAVADEANQIAGKLLNEVSRPRPHGRAPSLAGQS